MSHCLSAHPPASGSDEAAIREAQTRAFYSVLQVEEALPQIGVRVNDVLNDQRFLLMDIGLGNSAVPGLGLATRVIPFPDFALTGEAALPVDSKDLIKKIFDILTPHLGSSKKFVDLPRDLRTDLTGSIIRLCLSNWASSRVHYEDIPGTAPAPARVSPTPRIPRNAPCPCGSGHKYKKCCGKI